MLKLNTCPFRTCLITSHCFLYFTHIIILKSRYFKVFFQIEWLLILFYNSNKLCDHILHYYSNKSICIQNNEKKKCPTLI